MFTILLMTSITCLAAFWLSRRFIARKKSALDIAAIEAQLDEMIASFDVNDRERTQADRRFRRQIRQAAERPTTSTPSTLKKLSKRKRTPSLLSTAPPTPAKQPTPGSPAANSPSSMIKSTFRSAPPRDPHSPPPKKRLWSAAIVSLCVKAAITILLASFQFTARSLFNLFARKIPLAPPPESLPQSRAS
jgi:hypothetical protein